MAVVCGSCFFAGRVTRPAMNGVPNCGEVQTGLYRGGRPNVQGWQSARSIGVTNVVKLHREVADAPTRRQSE